jgi:hypothetical protein
VPVAAAEKTGFVDWDEEFGSGSGSGSGSGPRGPRTSGYQQRFRVLVRRDSPASKRRISESLPVAFLIAIVPTTLLLGYVLSWTLAMRAGFYRNELNQRVENTKIEQAELLMQKRQLQSPGYILGRAQQMGMQKAERRYLTIPASAVATPTTNTR